MPPQPSAVVLSLAAVVALAGAPAARAQGPPARLELQPVTLPAAFVHAPLRPPFAPAGLAVPPVAALAPAAPAAPRLVRLPAPRRPAALVPLYLSFAGLQTLDAMSTLSALESGGEEMNPVVGGLTDHPGALIAAKAGVAAGTVYLSERLWKKNRTAAVVLMAALNSAYALVVVSNHGQKR